MAEGRKTDENLERNMETVDETTEISEETERRIDEVDGNFESKPKKKIKKLLKKKVIFEYSDRILQGTPLDEVYDMSYEKMGKCIIFNHEEFDCGPEKREWTNKDAKELKEFFEIYEFDVEQHDDKKADEIRQILSNAAQDENNKKSSCFVCCVLTHGDFDENKKQEILYAKDESYSTDKLFTPFLGDKCKSLGGKPKLFFIQACRGDKADGGLLTFYRYVSIFGSVFAQSMKTYGTMFAQGMNNTFSMQSLVPSLEPQRELLVSFKIPVHSDFLIACSTPPRQMAWKREGEGSWFIQSLCETLWERSNDSDILSILTRVCRKVANCFESHSLSACFCQKKQVPSIYSTLTKQFRFPSVSSKDTERSS